MIPSFRSHPTQVGNIYCLGRKLGSGSFGEIYYAVDSQSLGPVESEFERVRTGRELAVKLERVDSKHPMLLYEAERALNGSISWKAKLLKHLEGAPASHPPLDHVLSINIIDVVEGS